MLKVAAPVIVSRGVRREKHQTVARLFYCLVIIVIMKNTGVIILVLAGTIIFLCGAIIRFDPHDYTITNYILMIIGALMLFLFYLSTLIQAITTPLISKQKKMLWIVVIICVPLVGNLIYVIANSLFSKAPIPKAELHNSKTNSNQQPGI